MLSMRKHYVTRFIGLLFLVLVFVTVCIYYGSYSGMASIARPTSFGGQLTEPPPSGLPLKAKYDASEKEFWSESNSEVSADTCPAIPETRANIVTVEEFPKLEFQVREFYVNGGYL